MRSVVGVAGVPAEGAGRVAEADDRRGVVPVADTHCQVSSLSSEFYRKRVSIQKTSW